MAKDFAKSKCFIKTDNGYKEITYCHRRSKIDLYAGQKLTHA